jgi:ADP-ribosylglycohydrolase
MGLHDHVQHMVYGPRKSMETPATPTDRRDRALGCLLGGAVGDALGAPLELRSAKDIFARHGPEGLHDFVPVHGTIGGVTDDTQLLLFACEALLRSRVMSHGYKAFYPPTIMRNAFRRWLMTQRVEGPLPEHLDVARGWLLDVPELWAQRYPDKVTLIALKRNGLGTPEEAITDSSGSGAIVRCAPAGMFYQNDPFRLGCELTAITHGHPLSIVAGGYLGAIIGQLMHGMTIQVAVTSALARGMHAPGQLEAKEVLTYAVERAGQVRFAGINPSWYDLEQLGDGKRAHDALALALYCALSHPEPTPEAFERAVTLAVNHSGASSIVGALTGQLLGTMHGRSIIPARWLEALELREVLTRMAEDLAVEHQPGAEWKQRYPPL